VSGAKREPTHQRVQELIAWWVNDTLESEERRLVSEHLAECVECRQDEAHCRALAARVRSAEEVAPVPHPARLERLLATAATPRGGPTLPLPSWLRATPRPVRWALGAQMALLVGLIVALGRAPIAGPEAPHPAIEAPGPRYRTLSEAEPPRRGSSLRVVFAADTPEQELRRIMLALGAEVVAGPTPLGAYTLALPSGAGSDPLSVVLEYLRALPAVRFAEPIAGGDERGGGER
jgi:hypothetical protein